LTSWEAVSFSSRTSPCSKHSLIT